jgi:hypothetical protein
MDEIDGAIDMPGNPLDQMIERWWEDHFPGFAVARDTASWNVAHAAKESLKRLLVQASGPAPGEARGPRFAREYMTCNSASVRVQCGANART